MVRKLIPLAVLIGFLAAPGNVPAAPDDKDKVDPNATYTITLRGNRAGDKTEHTVTESGTATFNFDGAATKVKQDKRLLFTETIIEVPDGAARATKLTRTYKTAQKYDADADKFQALAFEGKTVTIEKKGAAYEFSIDGKKMKAEEAQELVDEFRTAEENGADAVLTKKPVKIGEEFGPGQTDADKIKASTKLTKVYTKDGKQWGVVVLEFVSPKGESGASSAITTTLDAPIDGSARDSTTTMRFKFEIADKKGNGITLTSDATRTTIIKTLK